MVRKRAYSIFAGVLLVFEGCGLLYHIDEKPTPSITFPNLYNVRQCTSKASYDLSKPWWLVYENDQLNKLIAQGLNSNLSLQAAWERLKQSQALAREDRADRYPSLFVNGSAARTKTKDAAATNTQGDGSTSQTDSTTIVNNFTLSPSASYELDLWGRVNATAESSKLLADASRGDVESTALILSGTIAELWLSAQVQRGTLQLLKEQQEVGEKLLKLIKLRFKVGQSSALDVYQQQEQLAGILAEIPLRKSKFKQTLNQLAVLTGQLPRTLKAQSFSGVIPDLPPLPSLNAPVSLLEARPDLRAARDRVKASQFDIEAAIASKFPLVNLSLSYSFNAEEISNIFTGQIEQAFASFLMPIFEAGKLDAQVDERKANWKALQNTYTEAVLTALQDVENALIAERQQAKYNMILADQIRYAEATLRESRKRYLNGLTDYLQVTLAAQSLYSLQRTQIASKSDLILARNRLYLALGGTWTEELEQKSQDL